MSEYLNKFKTTLQDGKTQITKTVSEVSADISKSAQNHNINSPLPGDFAAEVTKATNILNSFTDPEKAEGGLDQVIPKDVFDKAMGLAVFTVVKAGFVWSGRVGSGLVIAKLDDGTWSAPSCISIGGLGFGAQFGADVTDFVIVLNTKEAVKAFSRGENVTLGGSLSVTAGPVGFGGEVSGSVYEGAALFSYSKSKGLFAGVSLEGTIIFERKDTNKTFYEKDISAEEILCGKPPPSAFACTRILYESIRKAEERQPKH
ncbi:11725_t:CDS:2 [Scutellospora calospora]|uniref:11725_t:CDS:1 n=1 Tax=Scutellospora calospora TaxID=85575 RepID=A0ACA9MH67_9GLOM|nr:11725_t:CDS:2 [Scutellospora calospora]